VTVYIDTSILAAAIFEEPRSAAARDWFRRMSERIILSDLTGLEFAAVVSRAVRTRRFDNDAAGRALASFDEIRADSLPYSHGRGEFEFAERLIRDFSTRLAAPDALHLASAKNAGAALATFDERLAEAASAQGVEVAALG
jgi:predicted nucleic acid-binding protein